MNNLDTFLLWCALVFFVLAFFEVSIGTGDPAKRWKPAWHWGAFAFLTAYLIF